MHKIEVKDGREVIKTVSDYCAKHNIQNAAIVSVIGAIDTCEILTASKVNPKENIYEKYEGPFELTGTGEVSDGLIHIHCTLGRIGTDTLMGHLVEAYSRTRFVHVYIQPLS
jgi:uncharacterized protein